MGNKPDPSLIDDDNPEWTEEDFARARPASEVLSRHLYTDLTKDDAARADRERFSAKVAVTLRIDREVLDAFKADGPGWQSRINDALSAVVAARRSGAPG